MPVEIERKFLVNGDAWRTGVRRRELYRQGYLAGSDLRYFNSHLAVHTWHEWSIAARAAR